MCTVSHAFLHQNACIRGDPIQIQDTCNTGPKYYYMQCKIIFNRILLPLTEKRETHEQLFSLYLKRGDEQCAFR